MKKPYSKQSRAQLALGLVVLSFGFAGAALAVSPEEAASIVREQNDGRILDVKSKAENGRIVYLIKVLTTDSRVMIVKVDGDNGQILE